ncbi:MAG: M48 family metallopeptidase [Acidobacteriota bacterium]|nr:M48 family metallopeptidase [Acidobacteriota bacterium]
MSKDYQAQAFHGSLPNGRAPGSLRVVPQSIRFTWQGGDKELPASGIKIRLGGAGDRLIFFEHPDHADWSIATNDLAVLTDETLLQDPESAVQLAGIKRKRTGNHALLIGCAGVIVALIAGLFALKPVAVDLVTQQVPVDWEITLGDNAFEQYKLTASLIDDPQLSAHLKTFTDLLTEHVADNRYTYRFYLVHDDSLNAFAFPGGNMVVHSGAVLKADRGEELLGVIAHEIAHVNRRHSIRTMVDSLGNAIILQMIIGDTSALGALVNNVAPLLSERKFSRENENDADRTGLRYLEKAQIDPSGIRDFFQKIQTTYENQPAATLDGQLNFLSTHPATSERIARIEAYLKENPGGSHRQVTDAFTTLKNSLAAYLEGRND